MDSTVPPATSHAPAFLSNDDPYRSGGLEVRRIELRPCEYGAPLPLLIFAPTPPGVYSVVVFQHGFMARSSDYSALLQHLASHGFVVVAPQMYEPGLAPLMGKPTSDEEAALALKVLEWLPGKLGEATGAAVRTDRLGIAGHSRGGKVAWTLARSHPELFRGIAGVDPVDGRGGPRGNQPRIADTPFEYSFPSLVIGMELGGSCAPAGDNHEQFYGAVPAPAWHVIVRDAGHGDMLDDEMARAAAAICATGGDRAGIRAETAGLLVAFFRACLLDDANSYMQIRDGAGPSAISVDSK